MPHTKKGETGPARGRGGNGRSGRTPTRRAPTITAGEPLLEITVQPEGLEQFREIRDQLGAIIREAKEARAEVSALRGEREQIGRELAELRQQLRAAQQQSLKETREGYADVSKQLTATAGRLGEAVRHAQEELSAVVRQAKEARRELEDAHQLARDAREARPAHAEGKVRGQARAASETAAQQNRLGVTVGSGVIIAEVLPDSPAVAAGLAPGDVIEVVNGTPIVSGAQLRDAVHQTDRDAEVALRVVRAGQPKDVTARLGVAEANREGAGGRNRLGVSAGPGVVVAEVLSDTAAAKAGLQRGDVIDQVNGTTVSSGEQLRDLVQQLPAGSEVTLRVTRAGSPKEKKVRMNGGARP